MAATISKNGGIVKLSLDEEFTPRQASCDRSKLNPYQWIADWH
jgi:hypothetical protein